MYVYSNSFIAYLNSKEIKLWELYDLNLNVKYFVVLIKLKLEC